MGTLISWFRNNLVTVIEVVDVILQAIQLIVNALARLVPGNKTIEWVHNAIKFIEAPTNKLKDFLLKRAG